MTISTTTNKINAAGDGIQTNFPYNFKVTDAAQMLVYIDDVLYGAAYTVNGVGDAAGGSVDIAVPPADLTVVTLLRDVPATQKTDYEPYRRFPSNTVENDFDLTVMRNQQVDEILGRAIMGQVSDDGTFDYTLPTLGIGKTFKVNATGDGFEETTYDPDEVADDSATSAAEAAASAAAALVSEQGAAADLVLTNADVVLAAAEVVKCQDEVVLAAAEVVNCQDEVVLAEAEVLLASEWAQNPEDVAIPGSPGEYSALHWAAKAATVVGLTYEDGLTIDAGGDCPGGKVKWARVGKLVTVSFENMAHTSRSNPITAAIIPVALRPVVSAYNTYDNDNQDIVNVVALASGSLDISYRDYAGTPVNATNTGHGSISYIID